MRQPATRTHDRLARIERVLLFLYAPNVANGPGYLGPMDESWRRMEQQVQRDLAAIAQEQQEPQLETRGAA